MSAERILIVEDEEPIAKLIEEALRRCGYRTEIAGDGDAALEKSWEMVPDLIILDLMLPRLDGWEVCRRLREDKKTKGIPIIMLTARAESADRVEGLEIGADETERLLLASSLDPVNLLNPFFVEQIAPQPVGGIRRVDHKPSVAQDFHSLPDQPHLRVLAVDVDQHTVLLSNGDNKKSIPAAPCIRIPPA